MSAKDQMPHSDKIDKLLQVEHHFASNLYAKEMTVPRGGIVGKHVHTYDHFSFLGGGTAIILTDNGDGSRELKNSREVTGPALITIPANVFHEIRAKTNLKWWCVHADMTTKGGKP